MGTTLAEQRVGKVDKVIVYDLETLKKDKVFIEPTISNLDNVVNKIINTFAADVDDLVDDRKHDNGENIDVVR